MTRRSYAVLIIFVAVLVLAAPFIPGAFVQSATSSQFPGDEGPSGIVPCGDEGDPECGLCQIGALASDSLRFAVYFAVVVATLLFVYAGFLYVTAGGDTGKISQATSIFGKVVVGLVTILTAWLIVDFILQTFFVGSKLNQGYRGPWNQIECVKTSDNRTPARSDTEDRADNTIILPPPSNVSRNICYDMTEMQIGLTTDGTWTTDCTGAGVTCSRKRIAKTAQTYANNSECSINCSGGICSDPSSLRSKDPTILIDPTIPVQ